MDTILNPKADISIVRHGREQEAVIVIDDVLAEPDQWRTLAARLRYGRIGPYFQASARMSQGRPPGRSAARCWICWATRSRSIPSRR